MTSLLQYADVRDFPIIDETLLKGSPLIFEKHNFEFVNCVKKHSCYKEYKIIDISFLEMSNEDGTPKFAVFTPSEDKCYFKVSCSLNQNKMIHESKLDSNIKERVVLSKYKKSIDHLIKLCAKKYFTDTSLPRLNCAEAMMSSLFSGLLPDNIREKINNLHNERSFDEIIIISEASNWKIEEKISYSPPNPDPLIVGIKDSVCYLIDCFDTTPLEAKIAFTHVENI